MDRDELGQEYPRIHRLMACRDIAFVDTTQADLRAIPPCGMCITVDSDVPTVRMALRDLEVALKGFRGTGTWDDYFPPADSNTSTEAPLRPSSRTPHARYTLDTGGPLKDS